MHGALFILMSVPVLPSAQPVMPLDAEMAVPPVRIQRYALPHGH
jgi:hypothetical protein